jgi:hypothetical protein
MNRTPHARALYRIVTGRPNRPRPIKRMMYEDRDAEIHALSHNRAVSMAHRLVEASAAPNCISQHLGGRPVTFTVLTMRFAHGQRLFGGTWSNRLTGLAVRGVGPASVALVVGADAGVHFANACTVQAMALSAIGAPVVGRAI